MPNQFEQITSPPQAQAEVIVNESLAALQHEAVYGYKAATSSGLTWGYYGGRWSGHDITAGTLALSNATNYIVVNRSTGAISTSTSAANHSDTANYALVYTVVASGGLVTTVTDERLDQGGIFSAVGMTNPMTTAGDLVVGGSGGAPGRLAAGSSGLILTSNGPGTAPSWQAGGGGGGSGGNLTLASLTWVNQGTATAVETNGTVVMKTAAVAGDNWRILKKAQTLTAPYKVQLTFRAVARQASPNANAAAALILRESGTGKFAVVQWQPNPSSAGGMFTWTNPTTFLATVQAATVTVPHVCPMFVYARNTGSQWYFGRSYDGVGYEEFGPFTISSFTPDEIGFGLNDQTTLQMLQATRLDVS